MRFSEIFGFAIIFIVVLFFLGIIWAVRDISDFKQEQCLEIVDIASDHSVISYLTKWADKNILDKNIYFVSGNHQSISARLIGDETKSIPLPDETKTRIPNVYFRFGLEKMDSDFDKEITGKNIFYYRIGYGRDAIIILKNDRDLDEYRGDSIASGHLKKISSSVYAYCAEAKLK